MSIQKRKFLETLISEINTHFNTNIKSNCRKLNTINARSIYYNIASRVTPYITLMEIGDAVNKSHPTVIWHNSQYKSLYNHNKTFKKASDDFLIAHPQYIGNINKNFDELTLEGALLNINVLAKKLSIEHQEAFVTEILNTIKNFKKLL